MFVCTHTVYERSLLVFIYKSMLQPFIDCSRMSQGCGHLLYTVYGHELMALFKIKMHYKDGNKHTDSSLHSPAVFAATQKHLQ